MSSDEPQFKVSKRAWKTSKREYRISIKQMVQAGGVLLLFVILMGVVSNVFIGVFAQIVSWFAILGIFGLAILLILSFRGALNRLVHKSDIVLSMGGWVIRLGEPFVNKQQLFSRLESLLESQKDTIQELVQSVSLLETMAREQQREIDVGTAVISALDSKNRSLVEQLAIFYKTDPKALVWIKETIEDILEKSWRGRMKTGLMFVLGVLVTLLLEEVFKIVLGFH